MNKNITVIIKQEEFDPEFYTSWCAEVDGYFYPGTTCGYGTLFESITQVKKQIENLNDHLPSPEDFVNNFRNKILFCGSGIYTVFEINKLFFKFKKAISYLSGIQQSGTDEEIKIAREYFKKFLTEMIYAFGMEDEFLCIGKE